jgi:hypothetical protein
MRANDTKHTTMIAKKVKLEMKQKFKTHKSSQKPFVKHQKIKFTPKSPFAANVSAQVVDDKVKVKKPKHLSRKISQAKDAGDVESLNVLQSEQEKLVNLKSEKASKWQSVCMKLVGVEKWNQEKFDKLVAAGLKKKKFLEALNVGKKSTTAQSKSNSKPVKNVPKK